MERHPSAASGAAKAGPAIVRCNAVCRKPSSEPIGAVASSPSRSRSLRLTLDTLMPSADRPTKAHLLGRRQQIAQRPHVAWTSLHRPACRGACVSNSASDRCEIDLHPHATVSKSRTHIKMADQPFDGWSDSTGFRPQLRRAHPRHRRKAKSLPRRVADVCRAVHPRRRNPCPRASGRMPADSSHQ